MTRTEWHVCIPIDRGLELLVNGRNVFNLPAHEALIELTRAKESGKKYITGCDEQTDEGRCKGHPVAD